MKKIENILDLTEGQEVYIKAKYYYYKDFIHCVALALTDNEYDFIEVKQNFKYRSESKLELFTAEPQEPLEIPVVGKEYEFKHGNKWYLGRFNGYCSDYDTKVLFTSIRPITPPSNEELKAIEYLKSLGYRIHK